MMTWRTVALVVAALWAGWVVNGWRIDAARTAQAEATLREAVRARVQADRDRIRMAVRLEASQAAITTRIVEIQKKIKVYVPRDRACDLSVDAVRLLNAARSLSAAAGGPAATPP